MVLIALIGAIIAGIVVSISEKQSPPSTSTAVQTTSTISTTTMSYTTTTTSTTTSTTTPTKANIAVLFLATIKLRNEFELGFI